MSIANCGLQVIAENTPPNTGSTILTAFLSPSTTTGTVGPYCGVFLSLDVDNARSLNGKCTVNPNHTDLLSAVVLLCLHL